VGLRLKGLYGTEYRRLRMKKSPRPKLRKNHRLGREKRAALRVLSEQSRRKWDQGERGTVNNTLLHEGEQVIWKNSRDTMVKQGARSSLV